MLSVRKSGLEKQVLSAKIEMKSCDGMRMERRNQKRSSETGEARSK